MRIGILPERIYLRSVERLVHKYNKDKGAACKSAGCALLCIKSGQISGNVDLYGEELTLLFSLVWAKSCIAAAKKPARLQAQICMNPEMEEQELRKLVAELIILADTYDLYIENIEVRTEGYLAAANVTLALLGERDEAEVSSGRANNLDVTSKVKAKAPVDDPKLADQRTAIVQVGMLADTTTEYIAKVSEDRLITRYSSRYIRRMTGADEAYPRRLDWSFIKALKESGEAYVIGEGGIFAALWDLGEKRNTGLSVDIKNILIKQETIEVCDFMNLNPYLLVDVDCILLVVDDYDVFEKNIKDFKVPYNILGYLTLGRDRVIINQDEERFLTEPVSDEIYKLLEK